MRAGRPAWPEDRLSLYPCPLAYFELGSALCLQVAARELAAASAVLGLSPLPTQDDMTAAVVARLASGGQGAPGGSVADLSARVAPGEGRAAVGSVVRVAVVPIEPWPLTGVGPWAGAELLVHDVTPPPAELAWVLSPWPLDPRSPARAHRFSTDPEQARGQRFAREQGADMALWTNLDGRVSRVGDWAVCWSSGGTILTPAVADGAPACGWIDRLVDRGLVQRTGGAAEPEPPFVPLDGSGDRAWAAVAPWGRAVALAPAGDPVTTPAARLRDVLDDGLRALS